MNQGRIRSLYKFKAVFMVSVRNNWTSATEEQTEREGSKRFIQRSILLLLVPHNTHSYNKGVQFFIKILRCKIFNSKHSWQNHKCFPSNVLS